MKKIINEGINKSNTKKIIWYKKDEEYNFIKIILLNQSGFFEEIVSPISDEEAQMEFNRLINQ